MLESMSMHLLLLRISSSTRACLLCRRRENLSDALEKMQACLDRAAESLIPPEVDEAKMKQIAKQCAPL